MADMSRGTGSDIPWFPRLYAHGVTITSVAGETVRA